MTATFDTWEWSARLALAERGIGYHEATPLIADARTHYEYSGQDLLRTLGSPEEFAAEVAADRPEVQDRLYTGGRTPRDYLSYAVFAVAFMGIPAVLVGAWAAGGITIAVTVAGLTGVMLAGTSMIVGHAAPGALRAAGYPRLAPWGFVLGGILVVGVGGGLIAPMRQRWETILNRAEQEAPRAAAEARTAQATTATAANMTDPTIHTTPTEQMPVPGSGSGSYAPGTGR